MAPVGPVYDRLAPVYDRRWRTYEDATLHAALGVFRPQDSQRLLDVACGTGELERLLLSRCPQTRILGADLSLGMLRQAVHKDIGPRVCWLRAEAGRLPLADGTFDGVFCANSFHYFRSPVRALHEMRRVLRPDGVLVLVDWCDDYLTCKLCGWWLHWTDPAFYRTYTLAECRNLLQQAELEVIDTQRFRVGWLWGLMRFVCRRGPQRLDPLNQLATDEHR